MRLRSRIAWFVVGALTVFALPVNAQSPAPTPPYPTYEVTGGYQFLHAPDFNFPFGLNLDGAWNGSKALGIAGEVGWATGSEDDVRLHAWNIAAGPRFNARPTGGKVWPFAQVLVGMLHLRGGGGSTTEFQVQPGGGVYVNAGDGWGWVVQGDYRRVFFEGEGQNQGRVFVGIRALLD